MKRNKSGLPWKRSGGEIMDAGGEFVAYAYLSEDVDTIMRAVNCHDELLESLSELLAVAERTLPGVWNPQMSKARAAIAKAKGSK